MKFSIAASTLQGLLQKAKHFFGADGIGHYDLITIGVDGNEGAIYTRNTNGWTSIECTTIERVNITEEGSVNVHGRTFEKLVRELEGNLSFFTSGERVSILCDRSKFALPTKGIPAAMFPTPQAPEWTPVSVNATLLCDAIKKALIASGQALNGDFNGDGAEITIKGKCVEIASTDGRMLSVAKFYTATENVAIQCFAPSDWLVGVEKIVGSHNGGEVTLWFHSQIALQTEGVTFTGSLVEQGLPPYRAILPDKKSLTSLVSAKDLDIALRRLMAISQGKTHCQFSFSREEMKISVASRDGAVGEEIVSLEHEGKDREYILNADFIQKFLARCSAEQVSFLTNDSQFVCLTEGNDDWQCVLISQPPGKSA